MPALPSLILLPAVSDRFPLAVPEVPNAPALARDTAPPVKLTLPAKLLAALSSVIAPLLVSMLVAPPTLRAPAWLTAPPAAPLPFTPWTMRSFATVVLSVLVLPKVTAPPASSVRLLTLLAPPSVVTREFARVTAPPIRVTAPVKLLLAFASVMSLAPALIDVVPPTLRLP